ncbi:hypothetical protein ACFOHS_13320 [Jhaorihella thermophila]
MAALIEYCENGTDHDTTPMPFKLPHIGRTIDAGVLFAKNGR